VKSNSLAGESIGDKRERDKSCFERRKKNERIDKEIR